MNTFWGVPYFVWLAICLLIAAVYLIFTPKKNSSAERSMAERFVLKYAHSIVWLLLALVCVLMNYNLGKAATIVSFTSLIVYLIFICTLIRVKFIQKK